jgi:hypothetical protein
MNNIEKNINRSLLKRLEALEKHRARKQKFVKARKRIIQNIEEARIIWKNTLEQLTKTEFRDF